MEDKALPTCIIHYQSTKLGLSEELIHLSSFESWTTLLEAARQRNHTPILQIGELNDGESIPDVSYHRHCRSRFTMKRELDVLRAQHQDSSSDPSLLESCRHNPQFITRYAYSVRRLDISKEHTHENPSY